MKAESSPHGTVMDRSQSCIITRRRRTLQSHRHIQLLVQLKGVVSLVEQELLPAALGVSGCSDSHHHVVKEQQSLLAEGERLGGVLVGQLALRCRGPDGV